MERVTSQTSFPLRLIRGASVSWRFSTTWRGERPLGLGPWASWRGSLRGCSSWSGTRSRPSRRRAESLQCQRSRQAATGQLLLPHCASVHQNAFFNVSEPSPSASCPPWQAIPPCSPPMPALRAGSTPPLTATAIHPDWVPCWSAAGDPRRSPDGATARAGCSRQTGAAGARGSAAPRGPAATWGECKLQETSVAPSVMLHLGHTPPSGTPPSQLGVRGRWTSGKECWGRGVVQSRGQVEHSGNRTGQRKDAAAPNIGKEEVNGAERQIFRSRKWNQTLLLPFWTIYLRPNILLSRDRVGWSRWNLLHNSKLSVECIKLPRLSPLFKFDCECLFSVIHPNFKKFTSNNCASMCLLLHFYNCIQLRGKK